MRRVIQSHYEAAPNGRASDTGEDGAFRRISVGNGPPAFARIRAPALKGRPTSGHARSSTEYSHVASDAGVHGGRRHDNRADGWRDDGDLQRGVCRAAP